NGAALWASNTRWHPISGVVMKSDGNLVAYANDGSIHWASNTAGHPGAYLLLQDDGNLVINDSTGQQLWATNTPVLFDGVSSPTNRRDGGQGIRVYEQLTSANGKAVFRLQDDGNIVLYRTDTGAALWASG